MTLEYGKFSSENWYIWFKKFRISMQHRGYICENGKMHGNLRMLAMHTKKKERERRGG
jgi:hypothetical protein